MNKQKEIYSQSLEAYQRQAYKSAQDHVKDFWDKVENIETMKEPETLPLTEVEVIPDTEETKVNRWERLYLMPTLLKEKISKA